MNTIKYLTPIRVATWLATYQDDDIVGKTHEPRRCPLADCLKTINATDCASVTGRTYLIAVGYGSHVYRDTTPWMKRFISLVDALHAHIVQSPVSAREAKDALLLATQNMRVHERVHHILGR